MATPDRLDLTRQEQHAGRVQAERTKRLGKAETVQAAVPAILTALLDSMIHTVRICDRCLTEHFQAQPELRGRDCLQVKCECWCTTRRDERTPR